MNTIFLVKRQPLIPAKIGSAQKKKKKNLQHFEKKTNLNYLKSFKYLKTIEKYLNLFMLFIDPLETNLKNKDT